jgi:hypothetical protein
MSNESIKDEVITLEEKRDQAIKKANADYARWLKQLQARRSHDYIRGENPYSSDGYNRYCYSCGKEWSHKQWEKEYGSE